MVLLVVLLAAFIRYRLLDMPLERDEGEYAYAGQLILQGIPPYELAYNMKLPGTYYAYALGMAVFGQTTACFFAGAKTFRRNSRSCRVRELWNNVSESDGFGDGGACDSIRGSVCGVGDLVIVGRHGVRQAEDIFFKRAVLWFGIFDEAAGNLFLFLCHSVSDLARCNG